jgi:hypothetical protein
VSTLAARGVPLPLNVWCEVDASGDVPNAAGNGGILAADTTPILRGNANETQEVSWATGNADPIATSIILDPDFSGGGNATLDLWVSSGAVGPDAASFTVETGWDGGALVSDTATDGSPSGTMHKITATIAAADIPDTARVLTIILTPAAHANDTIQLFGAFLNPASSA